MTWLWSQAQRYYEDLETRRIESDACTFVTTALQHVLMLWSRHQFDNETAWLSAVRAYFARMRRYMVSRLARNNLVAPRLDWDVLECIPMTILRGGYSIAIMLGLILLVADHFCSYSVVKFLKQLVQSC